MDWKICQCLLLWIFLSSTLIEGQRQPGPPPPQPPLPPPKPGNVGVGPPPPPMPPPMPPGPPPMQRTRPHHPHQQPPMMHHRPMPNNGTVPMHHNQNSNQMLQKRRNEDLQNVRDESVKRVLQEISSLQTPSQMAETFARVADLIGPLFYKNFEERRDHIVLEGRNASLFPQRLLTAFTEIRGQEVKAVVLQRKLDSLPGLDLAHLPMTFLYALQNTVLQNISGTKLAGIVRGNRGDAVVAYKSAEALHDRHEQQAEFLQSLGPSFLPGVERLLIREVLEWWGPPSSWKEPELGLLTSSGDPLLSYLPDHTLETLDGEQADRVIQILGQSNDVAKHWWKKPMFVKKTWFELAKRARFFGVVSQWSFVRMQRLSFLLQGASPEDLEHMPPDMDIKGLVISNQYSELQSRVVFDAFYKKPPLTQEDLQEFQSHMLDLLPTQLQRFDNAESFNSLEDMMKRLDEKDDLCHATVMQIANFQWPLFNGTGRMTVARPKQWQKKELNQMGKFLFALPSSTLFDLPTELMSWDSNVIQFFASPHLSIPQIWLLTAKMLANADERVRTDYVHMMPPPFQKGIPTENISQALLAAENIRPDTLRVLIEQSPDMLTSQKAVIAQRIRPRLQESTILRHILQSKNPSALLSMFSPRLMVKLKTIPALIKTVMGMPETGRFGFTSIQAKLLPRPVLSLWMRWVREQAQIAHWTAEDFLGRSAKGSAHAVPLTVLGLTCREVELMDPTDVISVIQLYRHELYTLKTNQPDLSFNLNLRSCFLEKVISYLKIKSNLNGNGDSNQANILNELSPGEIIAIGGEVLSILPPSVLEQLPTATRLMILEEITRLGTFDLFQLLPLDQLHSYANALFKDDATLRAQNRRRRQAPPADTGTSTTENSASTADPNTGSSSTETPADPPAAEPDLTEDTNQGQDQGQIPPPSDAEPTGRSDNVEVHQQSSSSSVNSDVLQKLGNLLCYAEDLLVGDLNMKLFHDTLGSKIVRGEKSCCIPSSLRAKWFSLLQKTYGADTSSWTEFDLAAIGDLLITVPEQDLAKIPRDSLSRAINPFLTQSGFDQLILIPGRSRKQRFITVCAESLGADGDEYSSAYKNLMKHLTEGAQVLANTVKSPEELVRTHSTRTGRTPRWAEFNKADGANPVPPQVDLVGQGRPVQTRSFFDKDKEIFLQSPRPQPYQYQNPNPSVPFQGDISAAGQVNFNANQQNQFQTRSFDKGFSGQPVVDIQQPYQYQGQTQSPGDLSFRKDFAAAGQINLNSGQPQTRSFLDKDKDFGIPQRPQPYQQNPSQGDISIQGDIAAAGQVNFNADQQNQFQTRSFKDFDKGFSSQPVLDNQQPYQSQPQGDLSFRKDFAAAGQINVNAGQPQTRSFLDKDVGIPQQPQPYQQNPAQGDISFRKDFAAAGQVNINSGQPQTRSFLDKDFGVPQQQQPYQQNPTQGDLSFQGGISAAGQVNINDNQQNQFQTRSFKDFDKGLIGQPVLDNQQPYQNQPQGDISFRKDFAAAGQINVNGGQPQTRSFLDKDTDFGIPQQSQPYQQNPAQGDISFRKDFAAAGQISVNAGQPQTRSFLDKDKDFGIQPQQYQYQQNSYYPGGSPQQFGADQNRFGQPFPQQFDQFDRTSQQQFQGQDQFGRTFPQQQQFGSGQGQFGRPIPSQQFGSNQRFGQQQPQQFDRFGRPLPQQFGQNQQFGPQGQQGRFNQFDQNQNRFQQGQLRGQDQGQMDPRNQFRQPGMQTQGNQQFQFQPGQNFDLTARSVHANGTMANNATTGATGTGSSGAVDERARSLDSSASGSGNTRISTMTCDGIRTAGSAAIGLSLDDLQDLPPTELFNCVEHLGKLDWDDATKTGLLTLLVQKLSLSTTNLGTIQLLEIGDLITAIKVDASGSGANAGTNASVNFNVPLAFGNMDLTVPKSLDRIAILGSKINDPQVLTVLADKFNADNSIFPGTPKNTRPDNLRIIVSSLGNIICGFSDKVVNSIFETDPALFIDCSPNLRNIEGCPIDVLSTLATHAVRPSNYGPPRVWTEEDLETIGVIFAGLKDDAISSIPPESMQGLQPNAIRSLPVESLRALRPEQLTRISYPAAKAFTQVQLNNLNTEQVGALKRALQLQTDELQVTNEDEARQEETRAVDQGQGPNQGVATGRTKGGDEPDTDPEPGTEAPQDTPTSTVSPTTATGPTTQSPHTTKSPESETETGSKGKSAAAPLTSRHFTQNHLLVILILTLTQLV